MTLRTDRTVAPRQRVAVVGEPLLHRDAIQQIVDRSPILEVVASVSTLDDLDLVGHIDLAVVVSAERCEIAVLSAPEDGWSPGSEHDLPVGWDVEPSELLRALERRAWTDRARGRSPSPGVRRSAKAYEKNKFGTHLLGDLTDRELDVLAGLAEGASVVEIGASLHISANTVRTHITNVLRRLDVHSRLEAVAVARRALADERARRDVG